MFVHSTWYNCPTLTPTSCTTHLLSYFNNTTMQHFGLSWIKEKLLKYYDLLLLLLFFFCLLFEAFYATSIVPIEEPVNVYNWHAPAVSLAVCGLTDIHNYHWPNVWGAPYMLNMLLSKCPVNESLNLSWLFVSNISSPHLLSREEQTG